LQKIDMAMVLSFVYGMFEHLIQYVKKSKNFKRNISMTWTTSYIRYIFDEEIFGY